MTAAVTAAVDELAAVVGTKAACVAVGRARATHYRHQRRRPPPQAAPRSSSSSSSPAAPRGPRALSEVERAAVFGALHSGRFVDAAPPTVYATLLDEGRYLASVSTMYRLLRTANEARERRRQTVHPARVKPELVATRPNEVWSWDITKLLGPVKWTYYYLYVVLDIFSRYAVGWMVAPREAAHLAERLLAETIAKHGIARDQLTVHADRGSSMASKPVALLLADLGITKTHSRPHCSNDNPYSESHFKTLKYRPEFPERFGSLEDARAFCQAFFPWYNHEHRHSGIGFLTPADVHTGRAAVVRAQRAEVLATAYATHPERFVRKPPEPPSLPSTAWINRPPAATAKAVRTP
jgi:putative transposase